VVSGKVRRLMVPALAVVLVAASVTFVVARGPARADVTTPRPAGAGTSVAVLSGDFTGDGKADLAVTGSPFFTSLPVAVSAGDGSFTTPPGALSDTSWAGWSSVPGVHVVTGDFNGDHKSDVALLPGPGMPWWYTVPVAMSHGDGSFTVTNSNQWDFASWAQVPGVQVLTGDFNGDGKTDIALLPSPGNPWWYTIPVAFSNGDGSFTVTNLNRWDFASWAQVPGVQVLTGDFNGDGKTDIALLPSPGNPWWYTIPVAFSNGDGTFNVLNLPQADFAGWAQAPGAQALSGDFNGDGKADIAMVGGQGWLSVPVALSNGDGSFRVVNDWLPNSAFAAGATWETAHANTAQCVHAADFNGDRKTDIALGCANAAAGVLTIPVAFSAGDGSFTVTSNAVGSPPPDWRALGFLAQRNDQGWNVAGDFNGDGKADLAVVTSDQASAGPAAVPVALSGGDGTFTLTAAQVPGLVENLDGMPGSGAFGGITGPAGKCVDAGSGGNGAQVVLQTCNGTPGQAWTPQGYGAITIMGGTKCLTAGSGGGPAGAAGTRVQLANCGGVDRSQHWQTRGSQLYNAYTGLCLDAGGSTADGTPLQVWGCNGTAAQNWTLPAGSALPGGNPNQGYEVAYQAADGHLGYINPDGTATRVPAVLAAGTSPAIVGLGGGGWVASFVAPDRSFWVGVPGGGQGQVSGFPAGTVAPGTSPSMAGGLIGPQTGPWMGDVHAVSGEDWLLAGPASTPAETTGQVLAGSSPSITSVQGGGAFEEAFAAPGGLLWEQHFDANNGGSSDGHLVSGPLSVAPGTSPAIAGSLAGGTAWKIAFHGADDHLWTVNASFETHVQYPYLLKPGSGVAIQALTTGGYVIVFQGSDGLLYKMLAGDGWLLPDGPVSRVGGGIPMAAGTRPAIALGNTGYEIATHGVNDTVWLTGPDNVARDTGQAIAAGTSPAIIGRAGSQPAAPDLSPVQATANTVTITWNDNSTNESRFVLQKRDTGDGANGWGDVYATDSDNPGGTFGADEYRYTDFGTGPGAQCYRVLAIPVVATSGFSDGVSSERCTVHPDPAQFPQSVPLSADQWDTFSANHRPPAVNGAPVDDLSNIARDFNDGQELVNQGQTWGVDLDWNTGGSCWIFRGQGSGDQLLTGQALAMETCDSHGNGTGHYLAHGDQTFGVDVVLQDFPSYEWHIIGDSLFRDNAATGPARPGFDLADGGAHALWSDQARKYLVTGSQTFGVDLDWFDPDAPPPGGGITQPPAADPGVGVLRVFNCAASGHQVSVWTQDTSVAGSPFQKAGSLPYQAGPDGGCAAKDSQPLYFTPPAPQHKYQVVVTDPQAAGCTADDPNNPACVIQPESRTITGNPSGAIETTTVGVGTDRSPFAANGLK
jgi:hypothetical protein